MSQISQEHRLTGEQRARVTAFASRVPGIARSLRRIVGIAPDECESAGYEALARAALRYDPAAGASNGVKSSRN